MANVKYLKKKIHSFKKTQKITSAMKLISTVKLAKFQDLLNHSGPYIEELEMTLKDIITLRDDYSHPFLVEKDNHKCCLVIMTSNRGLCGNYNNQLIKRVLSFIEVSTSYDFEVIVIGKKGYDLLNNRIKVDEYINFMKNDFSYDDILPLSERLAEEYKNNKFGRLFVAFNHFDSRMKYRQIIRPLLPFTLDTYDREIFIKEYGADFIYDFSPKHLLDSLIPEVYYMSLYICQLSALTAEHSARMNAMDSATQNSLDLINKLTIKMNKIRQSKITTELIEIISSAEALRA